MTSQPERLPGGRVNGVPHVNHDHWYAHDAQGDARYHLERPFPHGQFEYVGPQYRYPFVRVEAGLHRFWLPGNSFFEVAAWDWPLVADWCLDCGDDYVIYPDDDHPGWYLIYNIHTGQYVHAQYMGE